MCQNLFFFFNKNKSRHNLRSPTLFHDIIIFLHVSCKSYSDPKDWFVCVCIYVLDKLGTFTRVRRYKFINKIYCDLCIGHSHLSHYITWYFRISGILQKLKKVVFQSRNPGFATQPSSVKVLHMHFVYTIRNVYNGLRRVCQRCWSRRSERPASSNERISRGSLRNVVGRKFI